MKKHAIIPIFIPHRGCPNDCVFCNQRKITARTDDVTPEDAGRIIDTWLTTLRPSSDVVKSAGIVEAAFYGGSFTGLPIDEQSSFLEVAWNYKRLGLIDKIHLSTRPDYIDTQILDNLRRYEVDTIELGVQSLDDNVLKLSNRGHSAADVYSAVELIQKYGFEPIYPEELSIADQISIYRNAKSIIAAGGAALCNLIYCQLMKMRLKKN